MDKVSLLQYVDLMNRYDEQKELGLTLNFSESDIALMKYMKKMAMQDEEVRRFLNSINDLKPDERERAVHDYYRVDDSSDSDGDGVHLSKLVTLGDLKNHRDVIASMSKEDSNKLNYIINNNKILDVKYINLETLTYINSNNEEKEVLADDYTMKIPKIEDDVLEDKTFVNDAINMAKKDNSSDDVVVPVKPIKKEQKKPDNKSSKQEQSGYISAIFLFALTGFTGGILATVVTLVLSK